MAKVSPLEFYERIWVLLSDSDFPEIGFSSVTHREQGPLSAKRIYLRVRYRILFFDICAFPLGRGLTVSWWLHRDPPGVIDIFSEIPVFGFFLKRTLKAATYIGVDRSEAFQREVDRAVRQVVDELTEGTEFYFGLERETSFDDIV